MTKEHSYRLLRLIVVFTFTAALMGVLAWAWASHQLSAAKPVPPTATGPATTNAPGSIANTGNGNQINVTDPASGDSPKKKE